MKLSSHNEWDPLKEVIVGVAESKAFLTFPDKEWIPEDKRKTYEDLAEKAFPKSLIDEVNGDLETFMNNYADDLVWSPPNTNDSLSMEAFAEGMKGWHADFENFKFKDRQYYPGVSDGDYIPDGGVRVYGTWHYNHKATGKVLETKYYGVFQFNEEGKIAYDLEWFDLGGIFAQLEE